MSDTEHLALVIDLSAYRRRRLSWPQVDPDAELARIFSRERREAFVLVSGDDGGDEAA